MHGNEIMNTLILNWNLVSLRSTTTAHWEWTRKGGWAAGWVGGFLAHAYSVLYKVYWFSFSGECTVQYLLPIACDVGSVAVWVSEYVPCFQNGFTYFCVHVSVCVLALRKGLSRQWLKRLSSENTVANSNPSPWVLRLSHSITRFHFSGRITGLQRDPGGVVWQAIGYLTM